MPTKKKNGNGEGTIRQRKDGTWEARYTAPDGSRHSVYAKTRKEVDKKKRDALSRIDKGSYVKPDRMSTGQWLHSWFELYAQPRVREKTALVHADNIRLHIIPAIGSIPLQQLRTDQKQGFVNDLSKKLSVGTVKKVCEPLKMALKQAYQNHLISTNPAEFLVMPKGEAKEIHALSIDEQQTLLSSLPESTSGDALRFILLTGLRASELCGLRWNDIGADSFCVRRSAQYVGATPTINPPKSAAGRREIPLNDATYAILERQRLRQIQERLHAGSVWAAEEAGRGESYVFATEVGTLMDRNNLARVLRRSLNRSGLPSIGLHALRHTFVTNCVQSSVDPRTLKELVGHSKISMTLQHYAHSDTDQKKAALEAVANRMKIGLG